MNIGVHSHMSQGLLDISIAYTAYSVPQSDSVLFTKDTDIVYTFILEMQTTFFVLLS